MPPVSTVCSLRKYMAASTNRNSTSIFCCIQYIAVFIFISRRPKRLTKSKASIFLDVQTTYSGPRERA